MTGQLISFLRYLSKSTNAHGIHSPFVYQLVTNCFYKKDPGTIPKYKKFQSYKSELLRDKKTIEVTDFGAGSKVFKSNIRQIAAIAKNAGISSKKAKLLIKIVDYFKPKSILEIGTSLGMSTYCLHLGNSEADITSLEGCPQTAEVAKNMLKTFHAKHIAITTGDFKNTLPEILQNQMFDLIYFDGNHQKQPTLEYFRQCLQSAHNDSVFIFDDIHWSSEMEAAWEAIKNHPDVKITIDLYFWGIVFFRKEQEKEHFTIRV